MAHQALERLPEFRVIFVHFKSFNLSSTNIFLRRDG
jgi:hypothetical protein